MELIGERFGHIRVTQVVGQGGMGDVYGGYDEKLERMVALKVLNDDQRLDAEARERLLREARALSKLDHPNICRIYDYIETRDVDLLVLEYIDGRTLDDAMREGITRDEKLRIAIAIADVLVLAHRAGIVHRDLKPENVMLTKTGEVKVLDFGLARWLHKRAGSKSSDRHMAVVMEGDGQTAVFKAAALPPRSRLETAAGITLGTPLFMSPEQARGEPLTPASDMFSFGLVLQSLFTGEDPHPFDLTAREILLRVARGVTQPVKGAPGDVTALINRLKELAPADRLTAVEAVERLRFLDAKKQRIARRAIAATLVLVALLGGWRYTVDLQRERAIAVKARADEERRRAQADDLINFMVGELREKLEPAGRLEIMDDVAERVLAHVGSINTASASRQELIQSVKALNQLGEVRLKLGRSKEAKAIFDRALALAKVVETRTPQDEEAQRLVMNGHYSLATVYLASADLKPTLEHFSAQLAIAEKMAAHNPADAEWQSEVAQAHGNMGTTLEAQGDLDAASDQYRRSLAIKQELLRRNTPTPDMEADVATAFNKIGAVSLKLRRFPAALEQFDREIAIYARLSKADPKNTQWKRRLAVAHAFHAAVLEDLGRIEDALAERTVEISIVQALFDYEPTNVDWRRQLAVALNKAANLSRMSGHGRDAVVQYRRAAALMTPLLGADARPLWRRDAIGLQSGISRAMLAANNTAGAVAEAERAVAATEALTSDKGLTKAVVAEALMALAEACSAAGLEQRAARARQRAYDTLAPNIGTTTDTRTLMQWANVLESIGRADEARRVAERLARDGYQHADCRPCRKLQPGAA